MGPAVSGWKRQYQIVGGLVAIGDVKCSGVVKGDIGPHAY